MAYRAVFGCSRVPRLLGATVLARLPLGAAPLCLVLMCRAHGGTYALAGLVAGAHALGMAVVAPLACRAIDRLGAVRVVVPLALAYPTAIAGLMVSVLAGAPAAVLILSAAVSGIVLPPVGASMRGLWPRVVSSPDLLVSAYAIEGTLQEVPYVVGPLLVATLATTASPQAALVVVTAAASLGSLVFATVSARWPATSEDSPQARPSRAMSSPRVRTIALAGVAFGAWQGAIELVSMPAFAEHCGARDEAGIILASLSLGAIVGGAALAGLPRGAGPLRRYQLAGIALAVAPVPLLIPHSMAAMVVCAFFVGPVIALTFAGAYVLLAEFMVPGAEAETFGWDTASVYIGTATGTVAGGALIEPFGYVGSVVFAGVCGVALVALIAARTPLLSGQPRLTVPLGS